MAQTLTGKINSFVRNNWGRIIVVAFAISAVGFLATSKTSNKTPAANPEATNPISASEDVFAGASGDSRGLWVVFDKFSGYQTKADPQKIDKGANPVGQNTYINDGDRISVRNLGYELFPSTATEDTSSTIITNLYTFRKRDGTNIMLRTHDTKMDYYHANIGTWESLKTDFTGNGSVFGFADQNTNADQTSYVYYGNAVDNYARWTGNVSKLTGPVAPGNLTINVDSTNLFPATGTVIYCGVTTTYSAKTGTTFTIPAAASSCALGRGVAQVPQEFPAAPKGNILMVDNNARMFLAGVTSSTQTLFYSKTADASDFTFSSPRLANDGGVINMPEGGAGITGMASDEGAVYIFKRNLIKSVTFTQDENDLPLIKLIKPFDNKSQTVGAVSAKSIFAGGNAIFFVTPNNEIMSLSRIETIDYPQVVPISDIIKPTVNGMVFSSSTGIYWKNKAYFSAKQSSDSTLNDTLIIYDMRRQQWESPVVGLNANDFSIGRFNDAEDLYFGSASAQNVYKINSTPLDSAFPVTANWRSREETFGFPYALKSIDNFYIEGYITDNTELAISLLYDEDGFTQRLTTSYVGGEQNSKYLYTASAYNVIGLNPFGFERFGSNTDLSGKKKFRIYLAGNLRRVPFYSIQVEFASDDAADDWEILQYGYHVIMETQEMRTGLIRSF